MKLLAIVGSLRKQSFNRQLAETAGTCLEVSTLEIADLNPIPVFNQDIEYPAPESVRRLRQMVKDADGIWFFEPEYNHGMSGVMKNAVDWLSRPISAAEKQVLANKPCAISGITMGMDGTAIAQEQLVCLLSFLDMKVMNQPRLTIPNALSQAEGSQLKLNASLPFVQSQAKAFEQFVLNTKKAAE